MNEISKLKRKTSKYSNEQTFDQFYVSKRTDFFNWSVFKQISKN